MPKYENYTPEIQYEDDKEDVNIERKDKTAEKSSKTRAQRKSSIKPKPKVKKTPVKEVATPGFMQRLKDFFTGQSFKIICGIFLGCLTIYLAVTFFGYLSTCIADQSKIASEPVGMAHGVQNPGGEGGARLSELLINEGFGLGSFVIIFWIGALSLKLLVGKPRFKTLDFTIKCIVALITVSLIIGLLTYSFHSSINWGGYHGTYVNDFIINFIGGIGAVLLSIFMIALFIVICLRDLVNWIIRVRNKRKERKRVEEEIRMAREAKEAEILRMQEQEKYDDLRAGESAELAESGNMDVADPDELLEFDKEDGPLYDLTDMDETVATPDDKAEVEAEAEAEVEAEVETDEVQPEDPAPQQEDTDKMVVNVNQIDQSAKRHFKSEVEMYESHNYKFPPFNILRPGVERITVDADEQLANKQRIRQTLLDFGIPITRIEATVGPTVTLYEIVPEAGVKIAKIRSLVDDIALSLAASGVRIIAPIPGKGTVGIEVANRDPQTVSMQTIIKSKKYQESHYHLPLAIGSTISNEVYIADLAKMPHLLVAGATGQGKSVGLNAIVASLLYCRAPHEVKFVMIDPKQVEFSLYNKLRNHYMAIIPGSEDEEPVITDMARVEETLSSLCVEMDNRYSLLKSARMKNIEEYNAKIRDGKLNPAEGHKFLPYIVVIVDEFADLVMMSGKNVEMPIARLAQKARAVGMHVIIATQRPSTNVITGIIKANFPARVSFKVTSGIDSKTILDTSGAQQLIGRGDMLIFHNSEMVRVQCAYIDTPEVEAICDYVERQPYPTGPYMLPEPRIDGNDGSSNSQMDGGSIGERDALFVQAAQSVVNSNTASTSSLQRHFAIGYVRAGKIMDQLERAGIVGPSQGGKPRSILVDPIGLESLLNSLD